MVSPVPAMTTAACPARSRACWPEYIRVSSRPVGQTLAQPGQANQARPRRRPFPWHTPVNESAVEEIMGTSRRGFLGVSAAALLAGTGIASADKKYDDGASDTEIKIGNTNPHSGPASSYAAIAKTIDAYWKSVNAAGGINGRKVTLIS